jgi:hypothetical protein
MLEICTSRKIIWSVLFTTVVLGLSGGSLGQEARTPLSLNFTGTWRVTGKYLIRGQENPFDQLVSINQGGTSAVFAQAAVLGTNYQQGPWKRTGANTFSWNPWNWGEGPGCTVVKSQLQVTLTGSTRFNATGTVKCYENGKESGGGTMSESGIRIALR